MHKKKDEHCLIGRFGAPHGLNGWISIQSYTRPAENIFAYQPWQVNGSSVYVIEYREQKKQFVALLDICDNRDAASMLTHQSIEIVQSQLPKANEGEYYWHEIIGMKVYHEGRDYLGEVSELLETGPHDVLVIMNANKRTLIPFVAKRFILKIDRIARHIHVDWPWS